MQVEIVGFSNPSDEAYLGKEGEEVLVVAYTGNR
jgi:hypothetical protein